MPSTPPSLTSSTATLRPMLRLAMPVLFQQLLVMLLGLVDMWLAGRYLTDEHLAAIGLMSYVLWLIPTLFSAVAIGATALIARAVGAGDSQLADRAANQAFVLGGLLALLATVALAFFGKAFIALMQLPPAAAPLAWHYLLFLVPVIPLVMAESVGIACLRGAGDTASGFVAMAVVNVVNILVSSLLVTGVGPFPEMGWTGLAIGTSSGFAVGGLIMLGYVLRGRAGLHLRPRFLRLDLPLMRRLLRIGVPGGTDMLAIVVCHMWFLAIVNSLGTAEAAAHGLAIRIESLSYLPGTAFQVAAATLAGQLLGAGRYQQASRSVLMACLVGGGLLTATGVLFYVAARPLTELFLGEQTGQVAAQAAPLLRLVAFSQPSLALSMILTGALRGAGDTRWPLIFTFVTFLGVRIPAAYLLAWDSVPLPGLGLALPGLGLGVIGAWYAMVAEIVLRSLLVTWRFWHGGWTRIAL